MPEIKLRGQTLEVDILAELTAYEWQRPRWSEDKLIAGSPFRDEQHPSFFVTLTGEYAGTWGDSGSLDGDWSSGNLPKLLAYLRNETYEEAVDYLIEVYGAPEDGADIKLPVFSTWKAQRSKVVLDERILTPYRYRSPYLAQRGISEAVQRFAGIGFSREQRAVVIPWRHADGRLANVKYRRTADKTFWYYKGGAKVRTLVYNVDKAYARDWREVIVCEAEIDALSWMTAGKPAIAVGGARVSEEQLDLIKRSPIERLLIAPDNDEVGGRLTKELTEGLRGYVDLAVVNIPKAYKDANEALVKGVGLSDCSISRVTSFDKFNFK